MNEKTSLFDVNLVKKKLISTTLKEVYDALEERGYNPINQLVGYIISGDPGYISSYKDSRDKILEYDRSLIAAVILEDYLSKIKE
ncbi:MAG: IreB family regulatory phosphoprotein [Candidatus Coprovivens sp.]|jgi:uncharacterized protein (UPF0297 family)